MPFRDVIGHRRLVALLARSVERASVPPSLIFAGPSGVGKRLVALATAQAINCLEPRRVEASHSRPEGPRDTDQDEIVEFDACGVCGACTRIARRVHPAVLIIEPGDTGSIKVDVIREVVDVVGYRPFEGRRRVVIIDQADALVFPAQNALLKTLEEPPPASMFILITSRPDALLPTVRSRCPRLRFQRLGPDDIAAALMLDGKKNQTEARAIAATADGSIGRALEASAEDVVDARDLAVRVLSELAAGNEVRRRLEGAKDLLTKTGAGGASDREQLSTHLRAIASLLRDVELIAAGADRRALANPDVAPALDRLTAFHGDRGVRAFAAVDEALVALERNAGVKIVADWVALNL